MARPKSGTPPLSPFTVKLPPDLLAQVRRYAHLHHTTPTALFRQGVEAQLSGGTPPDGAQLPVSTAMPLLAQVAETLTAAAEQLWQVVQLTGSAQRESGNPRSVTQEDSGNPKRASKRDSGNPRRRRTASPQVVSDLDVTAYGLDPATRALRPLCAQGHAYADTGLTLYRVLRDRNGSIAYVCLACDAAKAKARRQAQQQAQATPGA